MKCSRFYSQYANFFLFSIVVALSWFQGLPLLINLIGTVVLLVLTIALLINYVQLHEDRLIFIDGFYVEEILYSEIEEIMFTDNKMVIQVVGSESGIYRHFIPVESEEFLFKLKEKSPATKITTI